MCEHNRFEANVNISRMLSPNQQVGYSADITIRCAECLLPFSFLGLPKGMLLDKPAASFSGCEARLPIQPGVFTQTPISPTNRIERAILMPPQNADGTNRIRPLLLPQGDGNKQKLLPPDDKE